MKAEVLHLLPIQPEKSGFRSWKHLHRLLLQHLHQQLLQHLHQHQLCHAWLWNGNQKLFIARQVKAFQFIVLHHRVEALTPDSCVSQLRKKTYFDISSFYFQHHRQRADEYCGTCKVWKAGFCSRALSKSPPGQRIAVPRLSVDRMINTKSN